ncbi:HNH endonuclease [Candidatus Poribacteria bacterium]|nr:HNH endonuclease [Candidatus Poribacteria bacterium]
MMNVYVINKNGMPLMPCKPTKARKLLRDGKARVANRCPFTIQLLWDCEHKVQPVTAGIDKGSRITGFCCVGVGTLFLSGEIHHRTDIKEKLGARRVNRRNRRTRKWYRPKRFLNRASSKRSGRLPPSMKANIEEVLRVVRQIPLPISHIVVEDVQIDIARLSQTDFEGFDSQQSNRLDENLRIATLMRDGYQCRQCLGKNTRLEAHHIIFREHGGKDTLENLITLCRACHLSVHQGKRQLSVSGVSGFQDQIAQRTMQGKASLYQELDQMTQVSKVFGYQTSAYRKWLDLPKSHDIDALCVATLQRGLVILPNRENFYTIGFRPRQTRRSYHDLPRRGIGRVRYQVNAELDGFRKGDVIRVKGKWVKQINSIYSNGYLAFACVPGEPNAAKPKDCQLLQRGQTVIWERAV